MQISKVTDGKWNVAEECQIKREGALTYSITIKDRGRARWFRTCDSFEAALNDAWHWYVSGELRKDQKQFRWLDLSKPIKGKRGSYEFAA